MNIGLISLLHGAVELKPNFFIFGVGVHALLLQEHHQVVVDIKVDGGLKVLDEAVLVGGAHGAVTDPRNRKEGVKNN